MPARAGLTSWVPPFAGILTGWFAAYRGGLLDIVESVAKYDLPAKILLPLLGH